MITVTCGIAYCNGACWGCNEKRLKKKKYIILYCVVLCCVVLCCVVLCCVVLCCVVLCCVVL